MEHPPPGSQPVALIVDDDALVRMSAADILDDAGFRTFEAEHAEGAVALLDERHASITVLFTDVDMPPGAMDGFALAREVAERWSQISILVASGRRRPGPNDMPEGAYFVGKPFRVEVVYNRLKRMLPDGEKPDALKG